jgi:transposase
MLDEKGNKVGEQKFLNTEDCFDELIERIGNESKVVVEASSVSIPLYDYLDDKDIDIVVAHPLKTKAIADAKIKTDKIDSRILADLLRADLIPESYMPDKNIRDMRTLVSHRVSLVRQRTSLKNRIHAVLTREGIQNQHSDLFGKAGRKQLESMTLRESNRMIIDHDLKLIDELNCKIAETETKLMSMGESYYWMDILKSVPGIGPFSAVLLISEIGDLDRFESPEKLCSYAGLVPSVYQSGNTQRYGKITKQGRCLMRWILIQVAHKAIKTPSRMRDIYARLEGRKGKKVAIVAVARKLLVSIFWMLKRNTYYQAYGTAIKASSFH